MNTKLYVAYGINLSTLRIRSLCPNAKPIAKSWLHDYQLTFRGLPYGAQATIVPAPGYSVPVVVWEITEDDEDKMDFWESIDGGNYEKQQTVVEVDGEMKEALIYIMKPEDSEIYGIPNNTHLELIFSGYNDFNFDTEILLEAVVRAHQESILKEAEKA